MNLKQCALLCLCLGSTTALTAQSVLFSDSLASDASNWTTGAPPDQGDGALGFSASGLSYTVNSPTAGNDDRGFRYLNSYQAFPTFSWSAQVDIHLAGMAGLTSDQSANLNLIVAKASDPWNNNADFALDRYNAGSGVVLDIDAYVQTGGSETHLGEIPNATTDVTLLISYDMTTGFLNYAYDSDGAANGYSFTPAYTSVDISGWGMAPTEPFVFYLVGASGTISNTGVGPTIIGTDAYFTNFVVHGAAVPEPATNAMLAGFGAFVFVLYLRHRRSVG